MKKLLVLFFLLSVVWLRGESEKTRVLSYSEWFAEMSAYPEGQLYRLENASIQYNPATDQRFLGMDDTQLAQTDSLVVRCKVELIKVHFMGTPWEGENFWLESRRIALQKIAFKDTFSAVTSKFEIKGFLHSSFTSLRFISSDFENIFNDRFVLKNCSMQGYTTFHGCNIQANIEIVDSKLKGLLKITMAKFLNDRYIQLAKCQVESLSVSLLDLRRFMFWNNTIQLGAHFNKVTIGNLEAGRNHFSSSAFDSTAAPSALFFCQNSKFEKLNWSKNTFNSENKRDWCLAMEGCKITDQFYLGRTEFPNPIAIFSTNITGSFDFGEESQFQGGVFLKDLYFNERSTLHWPNLTNKIAFFDYKFLDPNLRDSIQSYGLLEKDLGNLDARKSLTKSKRIFQSVFRDQGLSRDANAVMVEIKDLETAIWEHEYQADHSLNAYFNWKMNRFLKKFSAYGTNPVIAIIYSLKVILLFALFYLFLHNDWDLNNRKKIGKRLGFMLKYFQVEKGLLALDREEKRLEQESLEQLESENQSSTGQVPAFLQRAIQWYVNSNLLSNKLRAIALQKMDILSGTYRELPKAKQTRVALLSGLWLVTFLGYTLLVKLLNALTLSLNAFTTLGFGTIPTRGFSRYIVIVQGFIGWVLMTIFSVTLISQLLQ